MSKRWWTRRCGLVVCLVACIPWASPLSASFFVDGLTRAPAVATVGTGMRIPADRFPCANCHGADRRGGGQGASRAPSLLPDHLTRPNGARPAYTRATLVRAIMTGVDASGRKLAALMPQYRFAEHDLEAIVDDLLAGPMRPGVLATRLRLGWTPPPDAALAARLQRLFRKLVAEVNAAGGIYGRELELLVGEERALTEVLLILSGWLSSSDAAHPQLFPLGGPGERQSDDPFSRLHLQATPDRQFEVLREDARCADATASEPEVGHSANAWLLWQHPARVLAGSKHAPSSRVCTSADVLPFVAEHADRLHLGEVIVVDPRPGRFDPVWAERIDGASSRPIGDAERHLFVAFRTLMDALLAIGRDVSPAHIAQQIGDKQTLAVQGWPRGSFNGDDVDLEILSVHFK